MAERLDASGAPVTIDGITLRTPGLEGEATVHHPGPGGLRGVDLTTDALEDAFASEGLEPVATVELAGTREIDTPGVATRSTSAGEPALEIEVPAPGDDWGQVVLYTDESGVMTWNFATAADETPVVRGGETRTYLIRRSVAPAEGADDTRGLIGVVGRKILKVVAFPVLDKIGAAVGDFFAERWEEAKRPYVARSFAPDGFDRVPDRTLTADEWRDLEGGRALLFVHGTFSRAHTGFGGLPRAFVESLHELYRGRVFAFDHFTLSHDPRRNVEEMLARVPEGVELELDIICHSRGGLFSRSLAEKQGEFSLGSRSLRVSKVVFAATPNMGTALADARHLGDFIDTYTNLLNFVPDNGVTEVLGSIIAVVKQLALGAHKGLDGLQSMDPEGFFLKQWLNVAGPPARSRYYALAADYEPRNAGLAAFAKDRLIDVVFKAAGNDLVVPTDGVFATNGCPGFPIDDRLVFDAADGVTHSDFFANDRARAQILSWLGEA